MDMIVPTAFWRVLVISALFYAVEAVFAATGLWMMRAHLDGWAWSSLWIGAWSFAYAIVMGAVVYWVMQRAAMQSWGRGRKLSALLLLSALGALGQIGANFWAFRRLSMDAMNTWSLLCGNPMTHFFRLVGIGLLAILVAQVHKSAAQRRELLVARLRLLRAQLQPHFLFNTLQAIGATAPRDGAAAAHMTALLGDLLRQTLQEREGGFVSLAEENELLRPYVELQQLRFGDRLQFELDLPSDLLDARIPDLLLQPLVENALQHGIEQRPGAGRVRVSARREGAELVLHVADDGAGLGGDCHEPKSGTGLGATRSRLQTLFGSRASLALQRNGFGGCTATLRLPYDEAAHAA